MQSNTFSPPESKPHGSETARCTPRSAPGREPSNSAPCSNTTTSRTEQPSAEDDRPATLRRQERSRITVTPTRRSKANVQVVGCQSIKGAGLDCRQREVSFQTAAKKGEKGGHAIQHVQPPRKTLASHRTAPIHVPPPSIGTPIGPLITRASPEPPGIE